MPEVMSLCKGPRETFEALVDKGAEMCTKPLLKVFHQAFYAGCYIGFGGLLSMTVAGGLTEAAAQNPGLQTFVFAALFPVNLLIIMLTGGVLFTGTAATVPAAVFEGRAHWIHIPKLFMVSWLGNMCGAIVFAVLITYADMNTGLTAHLAAKLTVKKCSKDFLQTFVKGVGCNWLVCMAVFLCNQAQDMTGKMVGIWFPISCFVAVGFEHLPANGFVLTCGLLAGADVTVWHVLVKNLIPTTLGNAFAGAIIVAGGYSYAFGRLGGNGSSNKLRSSGCSLHGKLGAEALEPPDVEQQRPPAARCSEQEQLAAGEAVWAEADLSAYETESESLELPAIASAQQAQQDSRSLVNLSAMTSPSREVRDSTPGGEAVPALDTLAAV